MGQRMRSRRSTSLWLPRTRYSSETTSNRPAANTTRCSNTSGGGEGGGRVLEAAGPDQHSNPDPAPHLARDGAKGEAWVVEGSAAVLLGSWAVEGSAAVLEDVLGTWVVEGSAAASVFVPSCEGAGADAAAAAPAPAPAPAFALALVDLSARPSMVLSRGRSTAPSSPRGSS